MTNRVSRGTGSGKQFYRGVFSRALPLLAVIVGIAPLSFASSAWAEGVSIGDVCVAAGSMQRKDDSAGGYELVCDGANWQLSITHEKTGMIGIGTTSPTALLDVVTANYPVMRGIRTSSATSTVRSAAVIQQKTTSDMVDGFGAVLGIEISDDTSSNNYIADLGAVRDGADNTGALVFRTYTAGSGSEKMRVSNGGNVGIGDASPDHKLDVAGNIGLDASSYINFGDTDGTTGYGIRDNSGTVECKNSGGSWAACAGGGGAGDLWTLTGSDIYYDAGKVGIGTTSPNASLAVTSGAGYNAISLANTNADATSKGALITGSRKTNANTPFTGFGTWDNSTVRQIFIGGGNWGRPDATEIKFYTASAYNETNDQAVERMHIDNNGKVGIGTTSPFATLDVRGALYSSDFPFNAAFIDGAALAQDVGGGIVFGGNDGSVPDEWWAGVRGGKDNGTSGNYAGYLSFLTRVNGALPTEKMRITSAGNVGIGTTAPDKQLEVNSSTGAGLRLTYNDNNGSAANYTDFAISSGGNLTVTPSGGTMALTGDFTYTGLITDVSDRRMKDNIRPLDVGQLEKITALQGVSFTMKGDHRTELGFIAQDVEPIYPDLVKTTENGTRTMNYIGLIGPLVEAIKEQQKEIEQLRAENRAIAERLAMPELPVPERTTPQPVRAYNE